MRFQAGPGPGDSWPLRAVRATISTCCVSDMASAPQYLFRELQREGRQNFPDKGQVTGRSQVAD